MFRRIHFSTLAVLAVGGLLGWLAASGRLVEAFAQDKKAAQVSDGSQLPQARP